MDFIKEPGRIYAEDENGKIVAKVTFPLTAKGVVAIDHTFVDESLRGLGVADLLMEEAYGQLKDEGLKAEAVCSYAVAWYKRHPEKRDILAECE